MQILSREIDLKLNNKTIKMEFFGTDSLPQPFMLVLPGGGYVGHATHEGVPVVNAFLQQGFKAAILYYSVKEQAVFPDLLQEASAAVAYCRENAADLGIDPQKIYVVGFSAGGHLAAALGSMWHYPFANEKEVPFGLNRPDAVLLGYPLITNQTGITHGCLKRVAGELPTDDISVEKQVSCQSAPAFIWHCRPDRHLSHQNSLVLALAYAQNKVRYELHVYDEGSHGIALADDSICKEFPKSNRVSRWVEDAVAWLESLDKTPIDWFALLKK